MIKVGLVGEDPSDTSSIKNLLEKRYKKTVRFCILTPRIKGYHLDTGKIKKQLPIEAADQRCKLVIFIRDLDALESDKKKLKARKDWFNKLDKLINNTGLLLLNIWELEALILGDFEVFKKLYNPSKSFKDNPLFQEEPKEFLKSITSKSINQFHESRCPDLFKKLDIDLIEKNCSNFKSFLAYFDERLSN